MTYDAIVRNLEVLGEACKGGIEEDIVWNVVSAEVPALLPRLIALRSALEPKGE